MIVDTSALYAAFRKEAGYQAVLDALLRQPSIIPAPVIVEFHRVTKLAGNRRDPDAIALIDNLPHAGIEPFTAEDADIAAAANEAFGSGNGRGGKLNLLDLMVYAMAKRMSLPILCTGRDFTSTDVPTHPASRLD